jgi:hypothetical protein
MNRHLTGGLKGNYAVVPLHDPTKAEVLTPDYGFSLAFGKGRVSWINQSQ